MPLELSGPVFQWGMVRTVVGGMEVQSIPDQREVEGNYWEQCRVASAVRGDE